MTLADILASLFLKGHDVSCTKGVVVGSGVLNEAGQATVIGIADRTPVGVDEAIALSAHVLGSIEKGDLGPIVVLVDSGSQRMAKRDELLGLSEFLAHLAKCLIYADLRGRPTIGLLYGHTAAGAFIATALATRALVALPGGDPAVMDLPSMAKVTKLPLEVLKEKAKSTPVFAPGLDNLAQTGAVLAVWDEKVSLADQLQALLAEASDAVDRRDRLGEARKGRLKAANIAERVHDLALQSN